jgi:hypothetical protein
MIRLVARLVVCTVIVGAVASATLRVGAAGSEPQQAGCDRGDDYCVGDEITIPGHPSRPGGQPAPSSPGSSGQSGQQVSQPRCTWVRLPDAPGRGPRAADGSPGSSSLTMLNCDGQMVGPIGWRFPNEGPAATPAAAAAIPDLGQMARQIAVRLEGRLPSPELVASPAPGVPAVVHHPAFVAVANWTGTVTDDECAFMLCVTVTATPTLRWRPGEPGTATLRCDGAGTRFDPQGPRPQAQAVAAGACAHAYRLRTGAAGRPDHWAGEVTVTWNLTWSSTTGSGGSLPAVSRSVALPRAVDEVQAVITE